MVDDAALVGADQESCTVVMEVEITVRPTTCGETVVVVEVVARVRIFDAGPVPVGFEPWTVKS